MAKVNLTVIKNWFKTGLKPTQEQFSDTWDSFWHKDEMIPVAKIEGVQPIYDAINNHTIQLNKVKIYAAGELQVFKRSATNPTIIDINDFVKGIVENIYIEGVYLGGNELLLTSYNIMNQLEF